MLWVRGFGFFRDQRLRFSSHNSPGHGCTRDFLGGSDSRRITINLIPAMAVFKV